MVQFGAFEFDAATRRLRRDSTDIHLPPKAFELLGLLIEVAPRVVTKRELYARLWPGGAVADATLVALVKQLRRALGDRDRRAPLIRTVHRVGYALELPAVGASHRSLAGSACWLMVGSRQVPLVNGDNMVGRDATAQVRLEDPAVSRLHARITVLANGTQLLDLGSKNGTFCNSQRLHDEPVVLRDGCSLAFGTVQATYRDGGGSAATLTHIADPRAV
jgi:DNA-binding winged helix-turn-helix (wHTH) protein